MLTVEQRVQRGIAYLDLFAPANWRRMIDLDSLNMSHGLHCIAGQVFGDYHNLPTFTWIRTEDYGFQVNNEEYQLDWDTWEETGKSGEGWVALDAEWRRVLSV